MATSDNISLDNAADIVGYSKSHFSRTFKSITGFTFNNYIKLQRLQKGQRVLEKTKSSITEIADEYGFANSGYFSTVFKGLFRNNSA